MAWFEEFGFDENPFDTRLELSAKMSVGLEKHLENLLYYIKSGSIVFIEGVSGSGKSILLEKLREKIGKRSVYVDLSMVADLRPVIKGKVSLLGRIFGERPKQVVLLLDNAKALNADSAEVVKYNYDNNFVESIVFAGESLKTAHLPLSVLDRIGSRLIRLSPLSEDDAVSMVRNRIGYSDVLEDEVIRKIYLMSGKNGKKFLELCEDACKAAASAKSSTVTDEHLATLKNLVGGIDG
jgi:type II secretory pathway predicted ATPase ExeA